MSPVTSKMKRTADRMPRSDFIYSPSRDKAMKRQDHNPDKTEKRTCGSKWHKNHGNKAAFKQGGEERDHPLGGLCICEEGAQDPPSTSHCCHCCHCIVEGFSSVTGVLLGRQSVLYLYFGRQLFYTVRLEEGEVNHGLEQGDDLLRVAGLPQEVALLKEERCKRRHKGDRSLLTAQRENTVFQNATEHLQAAAVSSGSGLKRTNRLERRLFRRT